MLAEEALFNRNLHDFVLDGLKDGIRYVIQNGE